MKPQTLIIKNVIAFFVCVLLLSSCKQCHNSDAERNLERYKRILKAAVAQGRNVDSFVYQSGFVYDSLNLGPEIPIPVYLLRLDTVMHHTGPATSNLFYNLHRNIYPIYYKNEIVAAEELEYNNISHKWVLRNYQHGFLAKSFKDMLATKNFEPNPVLLRAPYVGANFIYGKIGGDSKAIYLGKADEGGFMIGKPNELDYVVQQLQVAGAYIDSTAP